jgi:peptidoglycan/LPS O-acetylase OafA/YrhL
MSLNQVSHARGAMRYRPDVDGLRAIAVLSVVIFHAFPEYLRGGYVGVDIFFVISGYLISGIILASLDEGRFSYRDFYSRRIKRIFPALLLVLATSGLFGWLGLMPDEFSQLGKHIAAGAAFIANFAFQADIGYFDNAAASKPLLHLWSLAVEEQFYIVWPMLLLLCWKRQWQVLSVIAVAAVISFFIGLYGAYTDPSKTFFSPLARFWELMIGGLLAYLSQRKSEVLKPFADVRSIVGLLLLAIAITFIDDSHPFPGAMALVPTLGAFLLISAGPAALINRYVLSNKALVWIGLISYPLYLWHWPLLAFARIVDGVAPDTAYKLKAIGISILLAALTFYFVERPVRNGANNRLKVTVLAGCMLAIGAFGLYVFQAKGLPTRPTITQFLSKEANDQFVGPLWSYTSNETCLQRYPLENAATYRWWFCMLSKDETPTLLLLGVSFANQLYPGLTQHAPFNHHVVLSIGTCDPARLNGALPEKSDPNDPCRGERAQIQEDFIDSIIESTASLRFVIMDGLPREPTTEYIERLAQRVDFLNEHAVKTIIFVPHVIPDYDIKGCYSRLLKPAKFDCKIPRSEYDRLLTNFDPLVEHMTRTHRGVLVFDQNAVFCDESGCSMIHNNMPLLRDSFHHMSEYGSIEVAKLFATWAKTNAPELLYRTP